MAGNGPMITTCPWGMQTMRLLDADSFITRLGSCLSGQSLEITPLLSDCTHCCLNISNYDLQNISELSTVTSCLLVLLTGIDFLAVSCTVLQWKPTLAVSETIHAYHGVAVIGGEKFDS
jgi:hypothetical protein